MIAFHLIWDLVYIFDVKMPWYESLGGYIWQQGICISFIFLSGFCWSMGKNKFKRGALVLIASLIITIATMMFMPEGLILFGVLSFIGSAMLIMIPLEKILRRFNAYIGFTLAMILFLVTKNINYRTLSFFGHEILKMPQNWYSNLFTAYLGFPAPDFTSADYFAIFPWIFLYISGYFLCIIVKKYDWMRYLEKSIFKPLEWCGKKSLIIYMLHQPLTYGVLLLIMHFK